MAIAWSVPKRLEAKNDRQALPIEELPFGREGTSFLDLYLTNCTKKRQADLTSRRLAAIQKIDQRENFQTGRDFVPHNVKMGRHLWQAVEMSAGG
jgi:hypothetical protein